MDRIIFLDGMPNMQTLERLHIGSTVKEVIDNDLAIEITARTLHADAAGHCLTVKDLVTRADANAWVDPGPARGSPITTATCSGHWGATTAMQTYLFDDRNVTWQTVESIGAQIHVLAVDDARGIADVLIRFQPNTPGKLHRHVCEFSTRSCRENCSSGVRMAL